MTPLQFLSLFLQDLILFTFSVLPSIGSKQNHSKCGNPLEIILYCYTVSQYSDCHYLLRVVIQSVVMLMLNCCYAVSTLAVCSYA